MHAAIYLKRLLPFALMAVVCASLQAAPLCIVPAKPGGGMDLTCKLTRSALEKNAAGGKDALAISYLPCGVGAVAWSSLVSQRRADMPASSAKPG